MFFVTFWITYFVKTPLWGDDLVDTLNRLFSQIVLDSTLLSCATFGADVFWDRLQKEFDYWEKERRPEILCLFKVDLMWKFPFLFVKGQF